ncbi:MAG: DUF2846 domain-containing protein [Rubrivivax sp.]|nr:MAG: DUF2846 domain-containing protein [Rubrivivax sp.]
MNKEIGRVVCMISFSLPLLVGLTGCATPNGPKFTGTIAPNGGQSMIYVYRVNFEFGSARKYRVDINGKEAVEIINNSYFYCEVPAGNVSISLVSPDGMGFGFDESKKLTIKGPASADEVIYVKAHQVATVEWPNKVFTTYLKAVSADVALSEMKELRMSLADGSKHTSSPCATSR